MQHRRKSDYQYDIMDGIASFTDVQSKYEHTAIVCDVMTNTIKWRENDTTAVHRKRDNTAFV